MESLINSIPKCVMGGACIALGIGAAADFDP